MQRHGRPVAGVVVHLQARPGSGHDEAGDVAVTGPDGRFAVDGFDAGASWEVSPSTATEWAHARIEHAGIDVGRRRTLALHPLRAPRSDDTARVSGR